MKVPGREEQRCRAEGRRGAAVCEVGVSAFQAHGLGLPKVRTSPFWHPQNNTCLIRQVLGAGVLKHLKCGIALEALREGLGSLCVEHVVAQAAKEAQQMGKQVSKEVGQTCRRLLTCSQECMANG